MSRDTLKTVKIDGRKYEIRVNDEGEFSAHVAADYLRADKLADLLKLMKRSAKKLKVKELSIPAMLTHQQVYSDGSHFTRKYLGITCLPITVIGYDDNLSQIKYRDAEGHIGKRERFGFNEKPEIVKPMTPDEVKEWKALLKAKDAANKAFHDFEKKFEFKDLTTLIKNEVNAAIDTPNEDAAEAAEEGDPR